MTSTDKSVSLVLGSGGARGLAHIGVIKTLKQRGYHIAAISGCSMGALVGGIYAAGKLDEFEQWVCAISRLDMLNLLDISWGTNGLVKGEKIIQTLTELVGDVRIEELPIPYTAVAADLSQHKEVWLSEGRLFDAIRASISIPLFFTPFSYQQMQLVDGGVLNPVPIAPTFKHNTDITIAVDVGGPVDETLHHHSPPAEAAPNPRTLEGRIHRFIKQMQNGNKKRDEDIFNAYDVALRSFDAMQTTIARQKLAAYPPDLLIEIPKNICNIMEFDRAAELIAFGREKAEYALPHRH